MLVMVVMAFNTLSCGHSAVVQYTASLLSLVINTDNAPHDVSSRSSPQFPHMATIRIVNLCSDLVAEMGAAAARSDRVSIVHPTLKT
jgi:hypothetical protein